MIDIIIFSFFFNKTRKGRSSERWRSGKMDQEERSARSNQILARLHVS